MHQQLDHRIQEDLARRSITGAASYLPLLIVLALATSYYRDYPRIVAAFGLLTLAIGVTRIFVAKRLLASPESEGWRRAVRIGTFVAGGSWSLFCVFTLNLYRESWTSMLLLVVTAGLVGGAASSLTPDLSMARRYHVLMLSPIILWAMSQSQWQTGGLGVVVALYLAFLLAQARHNFDSYHAAITDAEQLRMQASELEAARSVAETAARAKSEFLTNMSYEIRTPMNGVLGPIDLLLDSPLSEQQRELAETARRSGEALLSLLNGILDFSKLMAGKLELESIDFDVREVIEDVVALISGWAEDKRLRIVWSAGKDIPELILGDPNRVRQVLMHLVGNAVKFTERGEVELNVSREAYDELCFEVRDTGVGISAQAQSHLFQPFTQTEAADGRKYGGAGLGLAISRHLVEAMGGRIGVESSTSRGSTFWFTLPVQESPASRSSADFRRVRTLLVHRPAEHDILRRQVNSLGLPLTEATNSESALQFLLAAARCDDTYRVAIIDQDTPGLDPFHLANAIKNDARLAGTALILLTSLSIGDSADRSSISLFDAWATKPIRKVQLSRLLQSLLVRPVEHAAD